MHVSGVKIVHGRGWGHMPMPGGLDKITMIAGALLVLSLNSTLTRDNMLVSWTWLHPHFLLNGLLDVHIYVCNYMAVGPGGWNDLDFIMTGGQVQCTRIYIFIHTHSRMNGSKLNIICTMYKHACCFVGCPLNGFWYIIILQCFIFLAKIRCVHASLAFSTYTCICCTCTCISLCLVMSSLWTVNCVYLFQGCPNGSKLEHCPGQTDAEYRTEFSIWSITASNLLVATDIRNMTDIMKEVSRYF